MPTISDADETTDNNETPPTAGAPAGGLQATLLKPNASPAAPPTSLVAADEDEADDEDMDETLAERLVGLTEMLPDGVRNVTSSVAGFSWNTTKWLYQNGRSLSWVVASSACILALPIMFESERSQLEEQQIQQQRQILLGPNAAVSGAGGMMPPGMAMPQVMPPPQAGGPPR